MQIATSSLLAAQQARVAAQPRAAAQAAPSDAFESLFAEKAKPAAASATPSAPFARPGSKLDIRV